ncbi:hypothetical protein CCMSSC00406_0009543 [Pleurotus cornucopiae]|uniref:Uncharacterized protein n=1 Tax=Pleurotus cornucopiae TaxID=5321 RepID=A0ACB7IPQ1_PLECO|nr:hypothetical protein CCMSSC00406_0009543 [Pleurotus cornucopiae]
MSSNDFEQVVRLMPPPGTNYFKRSASPSSLLTAYELTILFITWTWVSTLNWRCDIYVYISGAAPDDPRFREKGGVITVMVVHQGLLEMPPTQGTSERTDFVQKVLASTSLSSIKQFPATDSASQSGDNYQYTINYQESIPLFKNHGNEVFMFDAAYKDNSTLVKTKQTGSEVTNGVQFALQYQKRVNISSHLGLPRKVLAISVSIMWLTTAEKIMVLLTGIIIFSAHSFFAWRVYILSSRKRGLFVFLVGRRHMFLSAQFSQNLIVESAGTGNIACELHCRRRFSLDSNLRSLSPHFLSMLPPIAYSIGFVVMVLVLTEEDLSKVCGVYQIIGNLYVASILATLNHRPFTQQHVLGGNGTSVFASSHQPRTI